MPIAQLRALESITSNLPRIVNALERIANSLEKSNPLIKEGVEENG